MNCIAEDNKRHQRRQAPTLPATDAVKNTFYNEHDNVVGGISKCENLAILGDFNASTLWLGLGKIFENRPYFDS